ncbi:response regulator transcription factor [Burkholderia sp. Ac-20379]|uniref:response regulator transcription factor n=1 Tax=Burkholderia sp. Ac-20379 TaxID=2703900 RepID=UPI0019818C9C|nr:response regulator transcription factor [Burkholderia sp. Ac-20379]MBN3723463.1 response regulator transcription factor [Burkholderia sp. Ac-20379]
MTYDSDALTDAEACDGSIRVVAADAHPITLIGIRSLLDQAGSIETIACVSSVAQLFAALDEIACDVLIFDYQLGEAVGADGLALIEHLRAVHPRLKLLVTSAYEQFEIVARAVDHGGIAGFLYKGDEAFIELADVVRKLGDGDTHFDIAMQRYLRERHEAMLDSRPRASVQTLSTRELEVVRMWSEGLTIKQISHATHRSHKTISAQKRNAMRKLGVSNEIELSRRIEKLL